MSTVMKIQQNTSATQFNLVKFLVFEGSLILFIVSNNKLQPSGLLLVYGILDIACTDTGTGMLCQF